MKLHQQQLSQHLSKSLAPIYLLMGDEIVLANEALDLLRKAAEQQAYAEKISFVVTQHFDWGQLQEAAQSLSLLSQKQIIELQLPTGKPGTQGSKALMSYASAPSPDKLLLIRSCKLDQASQKSKWFSVIEKVGVVIVIASLDPSQLKIWLQQHLSAAKLKVDQEGLQCLIDRTEGNLLAAKQAIIHLSLLYGEATLTTQQIATTVSNNYQFSIYECVDSALLGQADRAYKMMLHLQQSGLEPTLMLWALTREIKLLASMAWAIQNGQTIGAVMQAHRVWDKRKPIISHALNQHATPALEELIIQAQAIDCTIKGARKGNVWQSLQQLLLALSGKPILTKA